jgi:hypothetical protein
MPPTQMSNTEIALVTSFKLSLLPIPIGYVEIELISCLEISMLPISKFSASNHITNLLLQNIHASFV